MDNISSFYQSFVEQKITTAQTIAAGSCEGTYAEGALIMCAVISAMSAIAWPGKGQDRKRFVEIITRFSPLGINPKKVSGPLLVQDGKICNSIIGIPSKSFKLTEANDHYEEDIINLCPRLALPEIRKYSYANLLYEQIRCNYAHQYRIGPSASEHDSLRQKQIMDINESDISYVSVIGDNVSFLQVIYFPLKWIASVVQSVAKGLDVELSRQGKMPFDDLCLDIPNPWWLDGKNS